MSLRGAPAQAACLPLGPPALVARPAGRPPGARAARPPAPAPPVRPQVTNVREASQWLSYTYLYTRMTQVRPWGWCQQGGRGPVKRDAALAAPLAARQEALPAAGTPTGWLADRGRWPAALHTCGMHFTTSQPVASLSRWCPPFHQNPLAYGIPWEELSADPALEGHRRRLVTEAARELERAKMARFDERSGNLYVTGEEAAQRCCWRGCCGGGLPGDARRQGGAEDRRALCTPGRARSSAGAAGSRCSGSSQEVA